MSDLDLAVKAAMFALLDEIEEKEDFYHDFVEGEDTDEVLARRAAMLESIDKPAPPTGWIACDDALPENQEGRWSKDVIALSDSGDVFRRACTGGYWQRTAAFIESGATKITHWTPLPEEK